MDWWYVFMKTGNQKGGGGETISSLIKSDLVDPIMLYNKVYFVTIGKEEQSGVETDLTILSRCPSLICSSLLSPFILSPSAMSHR